MNHFAIRILPILAALTLVGAACSKSTTTNANSAVGNSNTSTFNTNSTGSNRNTVDSGVTQNTNTTAPASVNIDNMAFAPATITVKAGTKVTWTNNDTVSHNVVGTNGGPSSSLLAPGDTYSFTFNTAGSFPYRCTIHPSMTATVNVTS